MEMEGTGNTNDAISQRGAMPSMTHGSRPDMDISAMPGMDNMKMSGGRHSGHMIADFARRFWICLVVTVPILLLSPFIQDTFRYNASFTGDGAVLWGLAAFVYLYGGWPFLTGLKRELSERNPGMMTLVAVAISVAFFYSSAVTVGLKGEIFYWELATLVDIMLLGHWIEMRSVAGASQAVEEMAKLLPSIAHRLTHEGNVDDVPVAQLAKGDRVLVKPGEKIPTDGEVENGQSSVNESLLTGESAPIDKSSGMKVIGGAVNGEGSLVVAVTGTGAESYLSQVAELVARAQESKSRSQDVADRAARWLTVIAIAAGLITLAGWLALSGEPASFAVERMVTVMVITCPHALGLAVPLVIAVSTGISARNGLLIRNRNAFERARSIDAVVFDKTGTLTTGKFAVSEVIAFDGGYGQDELLKYAASVEENSSHPLALAITEAATERYAVDGFKSLSGRGAQGKVNGREVLIVSQAYINEKRLDYDQIKIQQGVKRGQTLVFVVIDGVVSGVISLLDTVRPESKSAVDALKAMGKRVIMITGDREEVAAQVALELELVEYFSDVLPEAKVSKIQELQSRGLSVAMVGDGVNDAPALAQADLGIAIGAGSDVAVETGDVILVRSNPLDVVQIFELSKATYNKMVQNLAWATGYNTIAIPAAAGAFSAFGIVLSPAAGAVLMSLSTVIVAINARLLRLKQN